jgi:hypothetical protein
VVILPLPIGIRATPQEPGERRVVAQSFRVVSDGDEQRRGGVRPDGERGADKTIQPRPGGTDQSAG